VNVPLYVKPIETCESYSAKAEVEEINLKMGSLPNLHELEEAERKREKRREYELLLEQRTRDTSRERERLSLFAQQRKVSDR